MGQLQITRNDNRSGDDILSGYCRACSLSVCDGYQYCTARFLYRASKALFQKGINVESFAQSLRQVNMQFVIKREFYKDAVIALNDELCIEK